MATMAAATGSTSTAGRPDSLSWSKSLVAIPSSFTEEKVNSYYAARKTSERNKRRSYKFVTESYVEASSLETASLLRRHATFVVVRGRCYRSQKKSGRPYGVTATFSEDGSVWASSCECAAKEGLCNHALALLRLVVLLKRQGYEEPPPKELVLTPAGARRLERNSRQQAKSATWRAARKDRLTASSFGVVLMRESWTAIGLRNLVQVRDLSRVRAIQHGIKHEPQAVQQYRRALHSLGHNVETSSCGLLVDPASPWLGASPDRLVFDPTEAVPHGVVEVKCPYTIWDCAEPDSKSFYMVKDSAGVYRLSRDHHYYFQLLGQMALSGSLWGDFVVYCKHFLIVERISFSLPDWVRCKEALDTFYFATLLPYLVQQRNRSNV
ncbi:hypothetical protein HPB47_004943 [Ixodes persulcatus]|uniref:Uncharacterized protein n=1 Tax=Ixodes persulcatus TaxID=34615 RepID=A0AC60PE75_IXOPE|nr:hypothetical protein HPB47_004943 [Ixodes persulcatus]